MAKSVSELQSIAQKLRNDLQKHSGRFSEEQNEKREKAFSIIQSQIGKMQGGMDMKIADDRHEVTLMIDSAIPRGPEHIGETEWFY